MSNKKNTATVHEENTEADAAVAVPVPSLEELAKAHHNDRFELQAENKVVNPIVLADLLDVRPQMIYNYIRKGKITTTERTNSTQKITIPLEVAQAFAQAYLLKKGLKAAKIQAELAGVAE